MFWGVYEGAETRCIRSSLGNSKTVVELGSSLGISTAHIAEVMDPEGDLICVEANPRLIQGLRQRALAGRRSPHVQVIHAAVTNYCGTTSFTLTSKSAGSHISDPRKQDPTIQVPALTLREILHRTGVTQFDLVSDIEGAEVIISAG